MSDILLVENRGRARLLTLNRPEAKNAFNDALYDAVAEALTAAQDDADVATVIVTGSPGAFTAGQDLGEMATRPVYDDGQRHGFPPFMDTLSTFEKPLIAAVNGVGVGIGLTMLCHCDIVLVGQSARLRAPFVSLGIATEAGSSAILPALVGWQRASHLLYTAAWIDSASAVDIGLAWKRVADDALLDEAWAVAGEIAAMPISSLTATKRLLLAARADAVAAARPREDKEIGAIAGGPANREAIAAFRERRLPNFEGL
jgi:enoyl-CoA hydratase/carnithine racemase